MSEQRDAGATDPTDSDPVDERNRVRRGRGRTVLASALVTLVLIMVGSAVTGHGFLAVTILLSAVVAGATYEHLAAARDRKRYAPIGTLIGVGDRTLHVCRTGTGRPVVVFEAGLLGTSLDWTAVQRRIAGFTTTVSYDRAGTGWSSGGATPRTAAALATELHRLLGAAGVEGPYVLVGHSFGGFVVRLFAARYPHDVAGIVFVDAAHEQQWLSDARISRVQSILFSSIRCLAYVGIPRLLMVPLGVNRRLPPELQPAACALGVRARTYDSVYRVWASLEESAREVSAAGSLGAIPLMVLTAKPSDPAQVGHWYEMQEALTGLSSRSRWVTAYRGDHNLHLTEPEMVAAAVRDLCEPPPIEATAALSLVC